MPIKGLTDNSTLGSGLPRIAKLYKGDEKPEGGRRHGKDLEYFRVEFEPEYEHLRPVWVEMYGDQPDAFTNVFLTAATVDDAFSSWKEEWNASQTLLHRCDGEFQKNWFDPSTQMMCSAKIACAAPKCGCTNIGRLNLLLPEFIDATGALGYISVTTHSINDILTVYRYLADIKRMHGKLTQIPFVFGRATKVIGAPRQVKRGNEYVNDGRLKVNKSLFYIHVTAEFTQERLLPMLAGVALPETTVPTMEPEETRKLLGRGGPHRLGATVEPESPKTAEPVQDWTTVWTSFKEAGFTPGNTEQIKLVFKVDDVMQLTPDEAHKRLKTYRDNKPTYGPSNASESH